MRASVPALILALTLASPSLAADGPQGAPQLSRAEADVPGAGGSDCGGACAPRLAYAWAELREEAPPPAILAASGPAPVAALAVGTMRAGSEAVQLLAAVRSEEAGLQTLAGLVTVAAPPPAAAPVPLPPPAPTTSPAPARVPVSEPTPPATIPTPDPNPPACVPDSACS